MILHLSRETGSWIGRLESGEYVYLRRADSDDGARFLVEVHPVGADVDDEPRAQWGPFKEEAAKIFAELINDPAVRGTCQT